MNTEAFAALAAEQTEGVQTVSQLMGGNCLRHVSIAAMKRADGEPFTKILVAGIQEDFDGYETLVKLGELPVDGEASFPFSGTTVTVATKANEIVGGAINGMQLEPLAESLPTNR